MSNTFIDNFVVFFVCFFVKIHKCLCFFKKQSRSSCSSSSHIQELKTKHFTKWIGVSRCVSKSKAGWAVLSVFFFSPPSHSCVAQLAYQSPAAALIKTLILSARKRSTDCYRRAEGLHKKYFTQNLTL